MTGLALLAGRVALLSCAHCASSCSIVVREDPAADVLLAASECVDGLILLYHDYFLIILICRLIGGRLFCFCCFECGGVVRILEKINMCIAGVLYFLLGRDLISDTRLW